MKRPTLVICVVVAGLLGFVLLLAHRHGAVKRRALVSAVTYQLDGHSSRIAALLTAMPGSNARVVEDAVLQELQGIPSTSLISRSMIRVGPAGDGGLECVIDTTSLGIAPRTIRGSQLINPASVLEPGDRPSFYDANNTAEHYGRCPRCQGWVKGYITSEDYGDASGRLVGGATLITGMCKDCRVHLREQKPSPAPSSCSGRGFIPSGWAAGLRSVKDEGHSVFRPPHAMNPFAPFKPVAMEFGRAVAFMLIFGSGVLVAYAAHDRVPNPTAWFWFLFWVLCFHLVIAMIYFRRVRHWTRWAAGCIAVAAIVSMSIRAWRLWM